MRVLFISTPDVAIKKGGLYIQIMNTKRYLERLGVEVHLYDLWQPLDKNYDLAHIFRADVSLLDTVNRLKNKGMKIVVSPIFASTHSLSTLRLINLFNGVMKRLKVSSLHLFLKRIMEVADVITPNTEEEIDSLSKGFGIPRKRFRKIPNGVDKSFYLADPSEFNTKYGLEDCILYTGWIGSARKNTLRFLNAVADINRKIFLIGEVVDEGRYTKRCLSVIKENPNIVILEALPHDSSLLRSAYAACDTFVLPSLFETPGLSALEAALAGAKIVITKRGGTTEYFLDMAEYIDPTNAKSIKRAIKRSLSRDKDTRLREHIKNNFLWDSVAEELYRIYQDII